MGETLNCDFQICQLVALYNFLPQVAALLDHLGHLLDSLKYLMAPFSSWDYLEESLSESISIYRRPT